MKFENILHTYKYVGLSGLLTAIRYGIQSVVYRRIGRQYIRKCIYDFEMFLDTQDKGISRTLLLFGKRELEHRFILQHVCKHGMTVLDIGSNIGYYPLIESRLIGDGKVIAVEPVPSNIELLRRNVSLNGAQNIEIVPGAISDSHGVRNFHLSNMSNLGTFHADGSAIKCLSGKTIPVNTFTIGEIVDQYGLPDLIRMDVEGHEVSILNSLLEHVCSGKMAPLILFETHLTRYSKENNMDFTLRSLFNEGYHVRYIGSSGGIGAIHSIKQKGYNEITTIATDLMVRSIFEFIKPNDAVDFICYSGGVRTVLLEKSDLCFSPRRFE